MAGQYVMTGELRQKDLDLLANCDITLQVLVDCSHAQHVRTVRSDRPGQPIITKAIELDATVLPPDKPDIAYGKMLRTLTNESSMSMAFQIYKLYQRLIGPTGSGVGLLKARGLKLEIPRFHSSILDLSNPPINSDIADAIKACKAPTAAEFNALSEKIRKSMGMYRRDSARKFVLNGIREPGPRIAVT